MVIFTKKIFYCWIIFIISFFEFFILIFKIFSKNVIEKLKKKLNYGIVKNKKTVFLTFFVFILSF